MWKVIYRTGGYARYQWRFVLGNFDLYEGIRKVEEINKQGYFAKVIPSHYNLPDNYQGIYTHKGE